jgi:hypothetical protein
MAAVELDERWKNELVVRLGGFYGPKRLTATWRLEMQRATNHSEAKKADSHVAP